MKDDLLCRVICDVLFNSHVLFLGDLRGRENGGTASLTVARECVRLHFFDRRRQRLSFMRREHDAKMSLGFFTLRSFSKNVFDQIEAQVKDTLRDGESSGKREKTEHVSFKFIILVSIFLHNREICFS